MPHKAMRRLDGIYYVTVNAVVRTWKNSPWRRPVLILAALLTLFSSSAFLFDNPDRASAVVQPIGRLYYGDATNTALRFQENGYDAVWTSGEESFTHGGSASLIRFTVAKPAITRDEIMVGQLKADGALDIIRGVNGYDINTDYARDWSNVGTGPAMTCIGTKADCTRSFDIAYERLSGRAMVVYADNTNQKLYYCYWDGTSWGPVSNCAPTNGSNDITLTSNGRPTSVSLKPKSGSDQLLMGVGIDVAGTMEVESYIWSGTAWGNGVVATDTTNASTQALNQGAAFDVEWDGNGDALVIYATTATVEIKYKLFSGGSWGSEQDAFNTATNGSAVIWMNAEGDPSSNRIAVVTNDAASDMSSGVWKGDGTTAGWTALATDTTLEATGTAIGPAYTDVQWERYGSEFIIVYQDAGAGGGQATYTRYTCTGSGCTQSTGATAITSGTTGLSDDGQFVRLASSPNSDDIMMLASDIDSELIAQHWNGSAWETNDSGDLEIALTTCDGDNVTSGCTAMPASFAYVPYQSWQRNWRFFDDETANDPSTGLNGAAENAAPTNVDPEEFIRLRLNVNNPQPQAQTEGRKKLQYTSGASCTPNTVEGDTDCTWTDVGDTSETSAVWRYASRTADGAAVCADASHCDDNQTFSTNRLTGSTQTGWYTTDKDAAGGSNMDHNANAIVELDYPLKAESVADNTTYYFRAYDVDQDRPVRREQDNDGANDCASATCTYPSLTTTPPVITIGGTVFMADGTTAATSGNGGPCDGSTAVISIRSNGGTADTATCSNSDATYLLTTSNVSLTAGNEIAVYLTSTMKANTVYLADGGSDSGINLYENRVVASHQNAGPQTIVGMDAYDSDQNNTDMLFDAEDLATDTLDVESGNVLRVESSNTFTPGGNVSTPKLHLKGTFSAGSGTHTFSGTGTGTSRPFFLDSGTFTASTSTVVYTGDGDCDIQHLSPYNILQLTPTLASTNRAYTFTGSVSFSGDFTINPTASSTVKTLTVNLGGAVTKNGAGGATTVTGTGTGASVLDPRPASTDYNFSTNSMNVTNSGGGGTLDYTGSSAGLFLSGTVSPLFTATGTFTPGSGTVTYSTDSTVALTADQDFAFNNVTINPAVTTTRTQSFGTGNITLSGNLLITGAGTTTTFTVNMGGNITVASDKTTTINAHDVTNLNTTLDTRPASTDYNLSTGFLVIGDATGGTDTLDAGGSSSVITLTGTSGTLFTNNSTFTQGTSTVRVTSASGTPTFLSGATTFYKLDINAAATAINMGSAVTIEATNNATLDITAGVFNVDANNITGPGAGTGRTFTIGASGTLCLGGTTAGTTATCDSGATQTATRDMPDFNAYSFNASSTVRYLSDVAQTVDTTPTYGNLILGPTLTSARAYTFEGAATINGNFTVDPDAASALALTVNGAGNITVATGKTATITRTGSNATSALDLMPVATPYDLTTGGLTIGAGGTLDADGTSAVITVNGDYTSDGTFAEGTSQVLLAGTSSMALDSGCTDMDACTGENFYDLTINKTDADTANDNVTLTSTHVRVSNLLTITDGELIQGTLNARIEGSSAVSINANGTWTNISTGDLKLGGTFVNNGQATFNSNNGTQCVDAADDIAISSTSGGAVRTWSGSGTETIYNVAVTDMADSTVTAYTSSFTNTTWTEGSCGISISGSCDQFDQSTDCTDDGGNQIAVAYNGTIQAQVDTVVDGAWQVTGLSTPGNGDIITIFIDGETTDDEEAVAVTKYDNTGNITGVVLYWRHLSLGSADNATLANADIDAYDNSVSGDEDIFFDVSAGDDLTVDSLGSYTDEELYIVASNVYRPASGGGGDVNTTHLENDGTITADSNAINVFGSWQNDGTFTAGTSIATFTSTSAGRTLAGTMTGATGKFNDLIFNGVSGSWSFSAAVEAGNDFTVTNGAVTASNNNLTVGRDFTLANTAGVSYTAGSSTLNITRHFTDAAGTRFTEDTSTVNQTGTGTITVGNGGDFNNLSIGYSSFTTTLSNNSMDVFGTLTFNGGTATGSGSLINLRRSSTGSSVTFASATTLSGTQTLYHIGLSPGSFTFTITGGNYGTWGIVPYAAVNSVAYVLGGNVSASTGYVRLEAETGVTGSSLSTTGSNYSLSVNYLNIAPCAPSRTGSWAVSLNDSTVTLDDTGSSLFVGNNCGSHTLNLNTSDVTVNGAVEFVDGTTSVTVDAGSSDFIFAPTASQTETYTPNGQSLWNMTINGANGAATIQPTAAVDVNNNFTISAGTYDTVSGSNFALNVGGNYSNSGTFTAQQCIVTFDATDTGNTIQGTLSGSSSFYTVVFSGSGGEWTPNAAVAITNNLTMTAGTLLGTQNVTVNNNVAGTNGVINLTGGTFLQRPVTSANFGTTSGSAAWTFNDLTFSFNDPAPCFDLAITTQTGGTGGITVAGVLQLGEASDCPNTLLSAGNRTWTLSGTGGNPFQIVKGDLLPETSTFTFTGNNTGGDTTVQTETYNNLIVNNGSETFNLEGTTVGVDVTVTAGTLALNSQTLQATDDLLVNGTLSGTTDVTVANDATGSGTVNLTGGTFYITDSAGGNFGTTSGTNNWTFNNLTFRENGDFGGMTITTQTGGSGGITVSGILTVGSVSDGTGTTLDAGNRTWTLSGTGGNPFQLVGTAPNLTPSTSTFAYTGNNGGGATTVQSETYNNLTVNNGSETYNLEGTTIAVATTVTAGTLALNGQTLQSTGTLTVDGTLSGTTNVTANGEVTGSGTINLTGGLFLHRVVTNSDYSFGSSSGSNNWTFSNLQFRNADTNNHTITARATGTGEVVVTGTLTIGSASDTNTSTYNLNTNDRILNVDGSVDITNQGALSASNSASFTVGDNWTNSGTFTHNDGTVTFDTTTTATFAGATTFYGFTSTTAAKTLEFTAGQTFTIATGGLLTLTGTADPNEIQIKSTTASQWFINHQGTESVSYVQVINSGCDGASTQISTSNSVDDGNNGACWQFGSTFSQEDYRFGQPNGLDIDYTGAPAENAAYTTSGTSDDFRLRMLLHVGGSNLVQNGETFKLQFGEKTAATCASGVSWSDVATGSGVIRYYDGGGRADGDNLTTNGGDPDHTGHTKVAQDYEEANNFTNSVAAINSGQDGLWDFSLVNHSAVGGKRYCFKAVKSTGTDIEAYNQYPEVIVDEELIFSLDATSKNFGVVSPGGNPTNVSSTLTTSTNSSTGYVVYSWASQVMTMGSFTISDWTGTNASPTTFGNGSFGFGYTTDDSSLTGGTADRFTNGGAKYAGFVHSGPGDPVADRTSGPITGSTDTVTYRLAASGTQAAGTYNTVIVYVCSVTF